MKPLPALLLLAAAAWAAPADRAQVFLDPGHGGAELGVRAEGLEEASLVLEMAKDLQKLLKERGVAAQLSREGSETLAPEERSRRANASGARAFVALHINHSPSPSVRGARIFVPKPSQAPKEGPLPWGQAAGAWAEESRRLANDLAAALAPPQTAKPPVQSLQLAAFKGLAMPAAFIELGYASHAESLERLKDASWRRQALVKMADALARHLKPAASGAAP